MVLPQTQVTDLRAKAGEVLPRPSRARSDETYRPPNLTTYAGAWSIDGGQRPARRLRGISSGFAAFGLRSA